MQDDRLVSPSAVLSGARSPARSRSFTDQLLGVAVRVSPLQLGMVQALIAFLLSTAVLVLPARQPGFQGIVNNANGPRAYRRHDLWVEQLGWFGRQLSTVTLNPDTFIWMVRFAHISLALLQGIAILAMLAKFTQNGTIGARWTWFFGPVAAAGLLLLYPPLCADVFFYITSGSIANDGGNPYAQPIRSFFDAPLLYLNDWGHIASPYGPLWTHISRVVVGIFGSSFLTGILGFRLLAVASAAVFIWLIYRLTIKLTDDRTLALGAAIASAWMPTLVFETAAGAHNDAVMFSLALGGLLVMSSRRRGATRLGLLLITASALLKYVTLPLLAFALLWRMADYRHGESKKGLIKAWAFDGIAILGLIVATFAPYWAGVKTLSSFLQQPVRGVSGSIWITPHKWMSSLFGKGVSKQFDNVVGYGTVALLVPVFVVTFLWLWRQMWKMNGASGETSCGATHDQRLLLQLKAWMVICLYLPFIPVDTHNWYAIWAIAPVAIMLAWLIKRQQMRRAGESVDAIPAWIERLGPARLTMLFLLLSCFNMVVYHTRTLS